MDREKRRWSWEYCVIQGTDDGSWIRDPLNHAQETEKVVNISKKFTPKQSGELHFSLEELKYVLFQGELIQSARISCGYNKWATSVSETLSDTTFNEEWIKKNVRNVWRWSTSIIPK